MDGEKPGKVAKIERSYELAVLYPELEQQLLGVELKHPEGNVDISNENKKKWTLVLKELLVDEAAETTAVSSAWTKVKVLLSGNISSKTGLAFA